MNKTTKLSHVMCGASAVLETEDALLKWMVAGSHISQMIADFETSTLQDSSRITTTHHEDTNAFTKRFTGHVSSLAKAFHKSGNPFLDNELETMGTSKHIMSQVAQQSVREAYSLGKKHYDDYVQQRLVLGMKSIHHVIQRTNLNLFNRKNRAVSKEKLKISELRRDSTVFCKMYVSSQSRTSDVNDFFAHKNQMYPPSISCNGKMRKPSNKSDIVECLMTFCANVDSIIVQQPPVTVMILDGAAVVHFLLPGSCKTFNDYCQNMFVPYLDRLLQSLSRIDIVFDRYMEHSLKAGTRESRGSGQLIKVTLQTAIPRNVTNFLAVEKNKE